MEYKKITAENKEDLLLPNEPFDLWGQLIVNRENNVWSYEIERFKEVETMVFPNENYEFDQIHKNGFAIGAYHEEECIGLAIYENHWNKYLYLSDLKVKQAFRKRGGELAAMVMIDATVRLLPGVVGNEASVIEDSQRKTDTKQRI